MLHRQLLLRLPKSKATLIRCLARRISTQLGKTEILKETWQEFIGHLAFAAQLSDELKYRKKVRDKL